MSDRLADIERRLAAIERHLSGPQHMPYPTFPLVNQTPGCRVCGMKLDRAMGYVCPHPRCPTRVTCGRFTPPVGDAT